MDEAVCMVVLWSSRAVASDWVKEEAQMGARRRILVPVLIEDIAPPLGFGRIEAAKLWDWDGVAPHPEYDGLLRAVRRLVGPSSAAVPDAPPASRLPGFDESTRGDPDPEPMPKPFLRGGKPNTPVLIALIGLVAVVAVAALGNWDKLFPPEKSTEDVAASGEEPASQPSGATGLPEHEAPPPEERPAPAEQEPSTSPSGTTNENETATRPENPDNREEAAPTAPLSKLGNLRVVSQSDQELVLEVDYVTREDLSERVGVGAFVLRSGEQLSYFGFRPHMLRSQRGTARVTLTLLGNRAPSSVATDEVRVDMYRRGSGTFHEQVFPFRKQWRKAVEGLTVPRQVFPENKSTFDHFARKTRLKWEPVRGAVSYSVEHSFLSSGQSCDANARSGRVVENLRETSYTFDFVGAQPGCWRVWAVGADSRPGPKSRWWQFTYTR